MGKYENEAVGVDSATGKLTALAGATVTVYLTGTDTPATIYSDEGVTPKVNPITTDAQGRFSFYAADGDYDLQIAKSGWATQTVTDVSIQAVQHNHDTRYYTESEIDAQMSVKATTAATQTALNGKVGTTGNESIAGVKTFSSAPVFSAGPGIVFAKNALINGGCLVAQRGSIASATTDTYGQVDRACFNITAVTAGTLVQQALSTLGRTGYVARAAGTTTSGGTGAVKLKLRIEAKDAARFINQTGTFQIKVAHDVGSNVTYTITARKPATTADVFSAVTDISNNGGAVVATGPTGATLTYTIAFGDCSKGIEIEVSAACGTVTSKNFDFAEWQLEEGSVATAFEYRDYASEFLRCCRYYFRNTSSDSFGTGVTISSGAIIQVPCPTAFRVPPTVSNDTYGNMRLHYGSGTNILNANITLYNANSVGPLIAINCSTTANSPGLGCVLQNYAGAPWVAFSAEL